MEKEEKKTKILIVAIIVVIILIILLSYIAVKNTGKIGDYEGTATEPGQSQEGNNSQSGNTGNENSNNNQGGNAENENGNNDQSGDTGNENGNTNQSGNTENENGNNNQAGNAGNEIIEIGQGDLDISKNEIIDIFNNSKFNGEKKIAPGSNGSFSFYIKNKSNKNVDYSINFTEEMQYKVNMKYRVKLDNIYIKGSKEKYLNLEEINLNEMIISKNSTSKYTIEWYWEDDDENDTIVGSKEDTQYYKLNMKIDATEHI